MRCEQRGARASNHLGGAEPGAFVYGRKSGQVHSENPDRGAFERPIQTSGHKAADAARRAAHQKLGDALRGSARYFAPLAAASWAAR
jgi:hypothetical protein